MYLDLHVHLRGTIGPSLARRLARRGNLVLDAALSHTGRYMWSDFSGFLRAYDAVAAVVQNAGDLEEVAFSYLAATAAGGTLYVEFMLSPPDLLRNGISYSDQLAALNAAWERSRSQFGIESRLIVTCVRHLGPEAALEAALLASSFTHPYVVGFGLTGDERQFAISDFAPAFRVARDAGLRLTAHAGEHCEAPSIREAVECLGLDRVGHGVRALEDPSVMSFLAERRTGLEICISSNLALGLYASLDDHPLPQIVAAGIAVSLGTDDPGFFQTSPAQEYWQPRFASSTDLAWRKFPETPLSCPSVTKTPKIVFGTVSAGTYIHRPLIELSAPAKGPCYSTTGEGAEPRD